MWKQLQSLQGLTRTVQGPSLLDLKKQVGVEIEDFQTIFLLGTFSFPLGNLIGEFWHIVYYQKVSSQMKS